ncbi:MAG: hypothetical protein H0X29_08840, partial [Parachlamydiaceae bacterium]|nr:hypothetical protein [Parachlamydiaceae bacterium]
MTCLFETEKIKDLSEMLSLNFEPLQRAVKQLSSHVFSIKINNHTGIALGHSLASDLEIEQSLDFLSETTLCYWWTDAAQEDLASRLKKKGFLYIMSIDLMKANLLPKKNSVHAHDVKILQAKTLEEKDLSIEIISSCFDTSKKDKQEWIDFLEINLGESHCFIYLAYWQNTPV